MILVRWLINPDAGFIYNIVEAHFVADIDGDFPETFDGNLFVMLVMTVDGQEDIENMALACTAICGRPGRTIFPRPVLDL
ncbi:MAG: hypothetical protein ABIJ57_05980 [Pseudomonadota bacterium]